MSSVSTGAGLFQRAFDARVLEAGAGGGPAAESRGRAFARFRELGVPTPRDERWRGTQVAALLARHDAGPAPLEAAALAGFREQASRLAAPAPGSRLVFLGGRLDAAASPALSGGAAGGPEVRLLREDEIPRFAAFGGVAGDEHHPFTALNGALFEDAVLIRVPRGLRAGEPLHLVFVSAPGGAAHPRVLVVAEESSEIRVVESWLGATGPGALTNAVTEISLGPGARVEHLRIQREPSEALHIGRVAARLERDAAFRSVSIAAGAALARVDITVSLDGPGAECVLDGLFVGSGRQHLDHHTVIDHAAAHATSRENYRGILSGQARGIFDGTIIVRPGAQKTDAKQANRNLLLSDDALVDTTPRLEIRADDVKCAHAATIGRLDEGAMFYLRSRGLDAAEARALLVRAFAGEITDALRPETLKNWADSAGGGPLLAPVLEPPRAAGIR